MQQDTLHHLNPCNHSFQVHLQCKNKSSTDSPLILHRGQAELVMFPPLKRCTSSLTISLDDLLRSTHSHFMHFHKVLHYLVSSISTAILSVYSFAGLFIITGAASMSSQSVSFIHDIHPQTSSSFWSKIVCLMKNFNNKDLSAHHFKRHEFRVHPVISPEGIEPSPDINNMHNHSRIANEEERKLIDMKMKFILHSMMIYLWHFFNMIFSSWFIFVYLEKPCNLLLFVLSSLHYNTHTMD
ncbi:hypothetical protein LWI28_019007 [Acer negundo]|uniref:Uncharacterized protein n=1 Tax=Acer negundo TaxID=4023 RepID=A0AAD5JAN4_ACENE|nr:hypothetical protein LWI28_019007 [Acer negundo]